ncbi:endolytic transglycosylase MltG [Paraliomyxa miuraensis]|uniref:endolytic transglycosylase MltG n=1 Tax=Paraliomyxa miuraensis TaxID=376150 RepID=UPI00224E4487|nr:endolytic transglycosylase MltG [Paraliomyxa miuraensis]MCX4245987.1 endolytic transglycosylase MltG [Paraliomyxa miuraensis]
MSAAASRGRRHPWWKPRRSRRIQRWALVVVLVSLGLAAWALHRAYTRLVAYPDRPGIGSAEIIEVEIPSGASFPQVLALLVEHGVIAEEEAGYFKLYVLHEGAARKTTAGPHHFRGDMTPAQILEELARKQRSQELSATIPEGKNILEVAALLSEAGLGDAAELEAAMRDPELLAELEIPGPTAEGYLFPDTYKFRAGASPREVITRMVQRHRQVFAELRRRHRVEAKELESQLGWGDHEIVILASIVEKETAAKHERPLIAGVFLNRLRFPGFSPKLLQTDPTIVYGCVVPADKSEACKKFEGRIRTIHLRDKDNPYSTYAHEGLPPGPIANPGKDALEAVLFPKKSRFLYFVSRNDGTHQFSKTVAEHEKAVDLYQRKGAVGDGSAAGAADP